MNWEKRIAITGLGCVSAWGWGVNSLWDGLCSGKTAIQAFQKFSTDKYPTTIAAQVPTAKNPFPSKKNFPWFLSMTDQFAVFSANEAIRQAGLPENLSELKAGIFWGTSSGGMFESENFYSCYRTTKKMDIELLSSHLISNPGSSIARFFSVTGPVQTESSSCVSSALAIGLGCEAINQGHVQIAITGGSDSLCRLTYSGFNALRSVDENPCSPFQVSRRGLSLGEGGATLVLENSDNAKRRGMTPLAILSGFGSANDSFHMTAPHPEGKGIAKAIRSALHNAQIDSNSVDFINVHGTGTHHNDRSEWSAIRDVFGSKARSIPITITKASVGHLLGAAGALEAVATILCIQHKMLHPNPITDETDPSTPVALVQKKPILMPSIRNGLSLNLGFGGGNSALVFSTREPS